MLESPNFKPDEEEKAPDLSKVDAKDLTNVEKLVIQAYINYLFRTLPDKEESTYELIRPYILVCVEKQTNWLVYSKALIYRSANEMQRHKMAERSLNQLQMLIDQFRDQATPTSEKIEYVFATQYPMSWGVK